MLIQNYHTQANGKEKKSILTTHKFLKSKDKFGNSDQNTVHIYEATLYARTDRYPVQTLE